MVRRKFEAFAKMFQELENGTLQDQEDKLKN
jgi:hypothetical protein